MSYNYSNLSMMDFSVLSVCIYTFSLILVVRSQGDICSKTCDSTYPLHTTDKVEEIKACLTGCRISYITQLTSSNFASAVDLIPNCREDCDHGYKQNSLQAACHLGCSSQNIKKDSEETEGSLLDAPFELAWHRQLFYPFHHLGRYCSNVYNSATSLIVSSIVLEDGSGGAVIMEMQMSPRNTGVNYDDKKIASGDWKSEVKLYAKAAMHQGRRWLNCVEARAGVPYWFLVGILFLSLSFIFWVFCSCDDELEILTKKHLFDKEISVNANCIEKPPPYDDDQAGPLPEKLIIM